LARRFAVLDIPELKAQVNLTAEGGGRWQVAGRLQATVVQACGITLDPVEQLIDEPFALRFAPAAEAVDDDTGELIVGADAPEPLDSDALDLGEIVADQFGLALDPFPRKPGAQLADILPPDEPSAPNGPFAPLAALRRTGKDDA
ncbi:MAG TPA: DUF177 domain-containing protein, partial [Vineibacter sp.]|nr:DUF177 domain-containing protein [Vineibacter sp.]